MFKIVGDMWQCNLKNYPVVSEKTIRAVVSVACSRYGLLGLTVPDELLAHMDTPANEYVPHLQSENAILKQDRDDWKARAEHWATWPVLPKYWKVESNGPYLIRVSNPRYPTVEISAGHNSTLAAFLKNFIPKTEFELALKGNYNDADKSLIKIGWDLAKKQNDN